MEYTSLFHRRGLHARKLILGVCSSPIGSSGDIRPEWNEMSAAKLWVRWEKAPSAFNPESTSETQFTVHYTPNLSPRNPIYSLLSVSFNLKSLDHKVTLRRLRGRFFRNSPFLLKTITPSKSWTPMGGYLVWTIRPWTTTPTFVPNVIGSVWEDLRSPQKNRIINHELKKETGKSADTYRPNFVWLSS
jgi:hypothetical protein